MDAEIKDFCEFVGDKIDTVLLTALWEDFRSSKRVNKKMKISGGIFGATSKSGHKIDELKSAMQKFARRGMTQEMIEVVYELDKFRVYGNGSTAQKAIRTNMINRIKIILFEDVSFAEFHVFKKCISLIKKWESARDDINSFDILSQVCSQICDAKKLRQTSYVRNKFKRKVSKNQTKEEFAEAIKSKKYLDGIALLFQRPEVALKLLVLRQVEDDICKDLRELISYCLAEYEKIKRECDKTLFLVVPWLWIMFKDELRMKSDQVLFFDWKSLQMDDQDCLKLPEYVYDQHTKKGKQKGRGVEHFRQESSRTTNVDEAFAVEDMISEYHLDAQEHLNATQEHLDAQEHLRAITFTNVDFSSLSRVELITNGVCGGKLPCVLAAYKKKRVVLKQMTKSLNFGEDYFFINSLKERFGLPHFPMHLVKMNMKLCRTKEDKTYYWTKSKNQVFCLMKRVKHKGDLGKHKNLLEKEDTFDSMLKLRLFRGVFNTSDNILRNILVGEDEKLYGIDENDVMGTRKTVFNSKEPIKKSKFFTQERVKRIIKELNLTSETIEELCNEMRRYSGLSSKVYRFSYRAQNYSEIVCKELGWD